MSYFIVIYFALLLGCIIWLTKSFSNKIDKIMTGYTELLNEFLKLKEQSVGFLKLNLEVELDKKLYDITYLYDAEEKNTDITFFEGDNERCYTHFNNVWTIQSGEDADELMIAKFILANLSDLPTRETIKLEREGNNLRMV